MREQRMYTKRNDALGRQGQQTATTHSRQQTPRHARPINQGIRRYENVSFKTIFSDIYSSDVTAPHPHSTAADDATMLTFDADDARVLLEVRHRSSYPNPPPPWMSSGIF